MFLGEYTHNIDGKGRLTIPSKYRASLEDGLVLTKGVDQNLMIYSMEGWHNFATNLTGRDATEDAELRKLRRKVFAGAIDLQMDKQGRVLLSEQLRAHATIDRAVIIAGNFDHIELWNPESWSENQ